MPRAPRPRYGIAEWFGNDITAMTDSERQKFGELAVQQDTTGDLSNAPVCPYASTLVPNARCNKKSGVCSIRKYSRNADGTSAEPVSGEKVVTTCPSRFLQTLDNGKTLFVWISEKMLDIDTPTVVKETPFLRKISESESEDDASAESKEKKAGRIDWLIVNPSSMESSELEWCAIETQALYFSGKKMGHEFEAYAKAPSPVLFPSETRRPDYRSSGPKRLSPQLDVKVPVLRNWGKKVVVVIDRFFYNNMNALVDAYPRARNDQEKRDNADVVWFVVDYDEDLNMTASEVIYTTLESSRNALNATEPLSKAAFTRELKQVIDDSSRTNKVFKASK
jgi:hypothetical protein